MTDQADTLRRIMRERRDSCSFPPMAVFTSAQSGVGTTFLSLNIAVSLARAGKRVLLVDAAPGGNRLLLFFDEAAPVRRLQLMSPGRVEELSLDELALTIEAMEEKPEFVLIDAGVYRPTSILKEILESGRTCCELVFVATPFTRFFPESGRILRALERRSREQRSWIVVNRAESAREAREIYRNLSLSDGKLTKSVFGYLGHCERDEKITQSMLKRKILIDWEKRSSAMPFIGMLARRLANPELNCSTGDLQALGMDSASDSNGNFNGYQENFSGEVEA
jgi:flagellar biosynthesis protein FlhG